MPSTIPPLPAAPRWLLCLLLCLLLWACLPAMAQVDDFIRARTVLEDPGGMLDIGQVQDGAFSPFENMLTRGYTDSAHWVRIEVSPPADGAPLKLRIMPTILDEVRLYEPDAAAPHGWRMRVSGDRHPFTSSDRSSIALGFVVHPQAPFSTYYLRLQTTSSSMLSVDAVPLAVANRLDAALGLLQIIYLGMMSAVLLWAWWDYRERHQSVTGLFVLYQLSSIVLSFTVMGGMAPFEPPGHAGLGHSLSSLSVFVTAIFGLLFHRAVFVLFASPRALIAGLDLLLACLLGAIAAYCSGMQRWALHASALAILAQAVLLGLLGITARQQGPIGLRVLRTVYALVIASLLSSALTVLGWVPASKWNLLAALMYGLLSSVLMLYMLSLRSRRLASETEDKLRRADLALQQLALEKQYAAEQERFTDMLTHELKTPISVALMSLGAMKTDNPYIDRIRRALGNIYDIVDRTRLAELAKHKRLQLHLSLSNVSERVYECIEASTTPDRVKASVGYGLEAMTDSKLLGIIISNLIDNALKYSPPNEAIELGFHPHHEQGRDGLRLVVTNPLGAAGAPDPERLFSKYYRSAGAHNKSGSGLGLYLSHSLAESLGARLSCRVHADKVEFELWLAA